MPRLVNTFNPAPGGLDRQRWPPLPTSPHSLSGSSTSLKVTWPPELRSLLESSLEDSMTRPIRRPFITAHALLPRHFYDAALLPQRVYASAVAQASTSPPPLCWSSSAAHLHARPKPCTSLTLEFAPPTFPPSTFCANPHWAKAQPWLPTLPA